MKQKKWMWARLFAVIMAPQSPLAFAQGAPDVLVTPSTQNTPVVSALATPEEAVGSKIEKKGTRAGRAASKSSESNKSGELRGLDRADQRAGQNGLQGRDTARSRQGR